LRDITEADAQQVLQARPDVKWQLMFALSRWGELRCPSETLALKWQDVDFADGVLHAHASKTTYQEHGGDTVAPIFVERRPLLQEAFEAAEEGAVYVISRHREH
jgi:integrase